MALTSAQNGIAVEIESRPGFTGFINIESPEDDKFREVEEIIGEEGKAVTVVGTDSTQTMKAKLVVKDGTSAPEKFDVLSETSPSTRKWLILDISRPREAGKKMLYELNLRASEGVALT